MTRIPPRKPFKLPMTCAVLISKTESERFVAHALEFDIVTEAATEREATEKLGIAMKHYITYGIANGWTDDILFDAPRECWSIFEHAERQCTQGSVNILDRVPDRNVILCQAISHDAARRVALPA